MKIKWIYRAAVLFLFSPLLQAEEGELYVKVASEESLVPLHLLPFKGQDRSYLSRLEKVLSFDLAHNGVTSVVQKEKALYQVEVEFKEKGAVVEIESSDLNERLSFAHLTLSGQLNEDRKKIHQIADEIYRALFDTQGIAETHLLYTIRAAEEGKKEVSEVWECDYDGGNPRRLTFGNHYCITPSYIPPRPGHASGSFCYVGYQTGQPKIYLAPLRGAEGERLTLLPGNQLMPSVSRQRDQIAFISDVTGNPDLFVIPFSPEGGALGKPRQIFSSRLATQGSPVFSPDGTRVAFVSNKDGAPRIYMMPIPSSGTPLKEIKPVLLTRLNRESTAPSWSPDGTKIAYCSRTEGVRQIWMYDLIKKEERQLTRGGDNKENPSWSPNSLNLVYNTTDPAPKELYLITVKNPKPVKISSGPGDKRFPNWEPRG